MIKRYISVVMGIAAVGIVATILAAHFSGEALFYTTFHLIQGIVAGTLWWGFLEIKAQPSDAMELRVCASSNLFLASLILSYWIDTDGLHPSFQWNLLGAIVGWVLSWGSDLLPAMRISAPSARKWFLGARVSIMFCIACYIVWIAATQPTWWTEEHFHRLGHEVEAFAPYDQYYRLGWHAMALLAVQLLALASNWMGKTPPPFKQEQ